MTKPKSKYQISKATKRKQRFGTLTVLPSSSEFKDELTPVKLSVSKRLTSILNVRMDAKDIDKLRQKGEEIGVGPTTFARMLLKRGLAA